MYEYLDRRYALALYEVASKKDKVYDYIKDLRIINSSIENNKELNEVLKNPQIGTTKKKEVFKKLFREKIDEELLLFLFVLIDKNRILHLKEKISQLELIVLEEGAVIEGVVKTSIPLTEEQYNLLSKKLEDRYGKAVALKEIIDPTILGGIYVKVNDEVIDGTLKNKVKEIKKSILDI